MRLRSTAARRRLGQPPPYPPNIRIHTAVFSDVDLENHDSRSPRAHVIRLLLEESCTDPARPTGINRSMIANEIATH